MKVYISADIEGVAGIVHVSETRIGELGYRAFQRQMTREVSAAARAALQAGAHEVWIKDAHATGRNLLAEELPESIQLIRAWAGHPLSMVQELDESFAALMMIGYHARAGSGGNPLSHTMSGRTVHRIRVNGTDASEFRLHAYAAGLFGVPVVLVTGDQALCDEVEAFNPAIRTVATSRGVGASTISVHPRAATAAIQQAAAEALGGDLSACVPVLPERFVVDLSFTRHMAAYRASFYPGVVQIEDDTIRLETGDWFEALRMLLFVL